MHTYLCMHVNTRGLTRPILIEGETNVDLKLAELSEVGLDALYSLLVLWLARNPPAQSPDPPFKGSRELVTIGLQVR